MIFQRLLFKKFIIVAILICSILVFTGNSYAQEKENIPEVGIVEQLGKAIPLDDEFVDENGDKTTIREAMDSKPTILVPVYYTCPGICNVMLGSLTDVVNGMDLKLGDDYSIISFSFNQYENVDLANEKKREFNALIKDSIPKEKWTYLTGSKESIRNLTDAMGYYFKEDRIDFFTHPAAVVILTPEGKISRYITGSSYLPFEFKMALVEASEGKIGSTITKILNVCFNYDPKSRKYVFNLDKLVGIITVILVLIFLAFLIRKKTNKQQKES